MGNKKVTIGYKYFMGSHDVLCQAPIDSIDEIQVGKRQVYDTDITSSQQIYIDKPEIFGGKKNEGGIQGYVDAMFGESTQGFNSYLQSKAGSLISAYRGVVSIVKRQVYQSALNPYPKPWAYRVRRTQTTEDYATIWNSTKANINNDMNPVHILYELLTNTQYGLGYLPADIGSTFSTVADTLYNEDFGLSFKWTGATKINSFIRNILTHINGVLYVDGQTGKFEIKLIRDDYNPATLPIYDESNIIEIKEFEVASPGETVNKVTIKYTDLNNYGKETSLTVHNLARINSESAVIGEEITYEGITKQSVARVIAFRDLRILSSPLAKLKFTTNRDAWNLIEGDVFKFSWDDYLIDQIIFRVTSVKYGTLDNPKISIDAIQDVFSIPLTTYLAPPESEWDIPNTTPTQLPNSNVFSAGYWEAAQFLTTDELSALTSTSAFLVALGADNVPDMFNIEMWTSATGGSGTFEQTGSGDNAASALLDGSIGITDTSLSVDNTINISSALAGNRSYAYIDDEMVRIDSVTVLTATTATITISRGVGDTIPATHADNAVMFFAGIEADFICFEQGIERIVSENIYTALLPRTTLGILEPPESYDVLETMTDRLYLPAPPAALYCGTQGSTSYYGGTYTLVSTVEWSWAGRNRLTDIGDLIPHANTSSSSEESGVEYRYEIRNQSATLRDSGWLTPPTRTITYDNSTNQDTSLEITLYSSKDSQTVDSWQTIVHTMTSV